MKEIRILSILLHRLLLLRHGLQSLLHRVQRGARTALSLLSKAEKKDLNKKMELLNRSQ